MLKAAWCGLFYMRFQPSFWDRLSSDFDDGRGADLAYMKAAVARDLERLLNARKFHSDESLFRFPQSRTSILDFGVPDFSAKSLSSGVDRDHICAGMAAAIERHERRLKGVIVTLRPLQSEVHRLAFDIHATLMLRGFKDDVDFGAHFDSAGMHFRVT
jgi:type VI secretion system protein ImpF